ncbi:MAG: protoheme IX farnesyltransferase [Deltaproteobacteria bacterium]|nr:protoheme IX farnesyltransferase [Deltaproteobacteria bacterium]
MGERRAGGRFGLIPSSPLKPSAALLAKPGIVAAVTLAGFAGMVLARRGLPDARVAALTLSCILGAAGGSAALNTVLDEEMDRKMPRLSGRVRALRSVGRATTAGVAIAAVVASVGASAVFLNPTVSVLLAAAAVGYVVLYTLVWKRRSPYGTIPGAVPGALPVLIGYAAVRPSLGIDGVLLFLFLVLWQPPHFWALALRHGEEYRAAGVPVLPVAFGETYTKVLIFLYAAALPPVSLSLWALGGLSGRFGWAAAILGAGFLAVFYRDTVSTRRYGRAFAASIAYLVLVLASLLADLLLPAAI